MAAPPPRSVLIVEDERIFAEDLQDSLTELGYDAFAIASSADEAVEQIAERCPDIVLMDIRIKGALDGIETAALLRKQFDVPVIYLSANTDRATLMRANTTQPYGYLLKPIKEAELLSALEVSLHRHQVERRLRQRERWFSTTLRSIADAVVTVDLGGTVTFMNPAAERLSGIPAASALGRPAAEVLRLVGRDGASPIEATFARALRDNRPVSGDAALVSANGQRLISDSAAPVVEDGELLGAVVVLRDVTDQKRMQRQLELADRLASLGTLTAGVAHEINNPLAVVIATSDFLRGELDDVTGGVRAGRVPAGELVERLAELAQVQGEISTAGTRISKIVTDLKVFSRTAEPASGEADVGRAIQWAVRTTAHEFRHRARLHHEIAALPPALADETRLGQVFVNLLKNAAQVIAPGRAAEHEVAIRARAERRQIIVEVRDTGPGIPREAMDRIFEPFFTTGDVGEGTGLGLAVCHGIVTAMGGEIQVDSAPGKGATFRVILRAATQPTVPPPPQAAAPSQPRRGRILVVDDDPLIHRTMKRLLREHELVSTDAAQDALDLLARDDKFDVILSDLMMPAMTGIEFFQRLRQRSPELARRVVFVTGGARATSGAEDFLRSIPNTTLDKPFGKPELQRVIARALDDRDPARGGGRP
jgi:PAS domain S-box-containing protein